MDDMNYSDILARCGVEKDTPRYDYPTQENKSRNILTEPEIKGSTFLKVENLNLKKHINDHSTKNIKRSCFSNNLNNEHIFTCFTCWSPLRTPKNVVRATPKLEEETEWGW